MLWRNGIKTFVKYLRRFGYMLYGVGIGVMLGAILADKGFYNDTLYPQFLFFGLIVAAGLLARIRTKEEREELEVRSEKRKKRISIRYGRLVRKIGEKNMNRISRAGWTGVIIGFVVMFFQSAFLSHYSMFMQTIALVCIISSALIAGIFTYLKKIIFELDE